jgi:hypothetical protein
MTGIVLGLATIVIWMLTFSVNFGGDYSPILFPVMSAVLEWNKVYEPLTLPFGLWYWGASLQWFFLGVGVDLLRWTVRFYRHSKENSHAVWRWLAFVGIGWAVLVPLGLFLREYNNSEFKQLQKLERNMDFADSKYYIFAPIDKDVHVPKERLEQNSAEIRRLVDMRDYRFDEFAATIAVSSIGIIVLSAYIFRSSKK